MPRLGRSAPEAAVRDPEQTHLADFDVAYPTPRRTPEPAPVSRRRRRGWFLLGLDVVALGVATAANAIGAATAGAPVGPPIWMALYMALTIAAIAARRGYRFRLKLSPFEYVGQIVGATALAATLIIAARVALDPDPQAATQVVRIWAFSTVYLIGGRVAAELAAKRAVAGGLNTLIIGSGAIGNTLARRLHERPELGLKPIGFLDNDPLIDANAEPHGVPVLGSSWDLEEVVRRHAVEHVIVAFSTAPHDVLLRIVRRCRALGLDVSLVPRLFEEMSRRVTVEHVGGIALARVDRTDPRGWQFECKYAIDRVVGAALLLVTAPLILAVALAVKLSSPGPIFFRQRRVGLDDREFDILKFRTMRVDPEGRENDARWVAQTLGVFDETEDVTAEDRRTGVGRLLRRTSLDELPQLLNIVRGEMSLIGPRPERTGCANLFGQHVYRYGDRHRVKSGLTGWAQVNRLRGQTSLQDRIEWDNFYIENWSPWLDLKILLLTPAAVLQSNDS
ncbi:MAG TPA: exopolysaccharide biosynthesis polyprenyl glycosylphosphotransferase [Solirubrobacteraceae bacterium]|nr:exopolysaccharide biosynthesis polyprenyl glycosylphosphotransferase [Solirubrobacteraceae bacterium]